MNNIKLSTEFEKAIEYITNVIKTQEKFLDIDFLYDSYLSMRFKNALNYVDFCEAYICVAKAISELSEA